MAYQSIAAQIDRHRTNPDDEMKRRGVVDSLLYQTRHDSPEQAAATLISTALSGVYHNSYIGEVKFGRETKRKLNAVAHRLTNTKVPKTRKTPKVKATAAKTETKKK